MRHIFRVLVVIALAAAGLNAQNSYLNPSDGYKANNILEEYTSFSCFDIENGNLYANDGDTVWCLEIETGEILSTYVKPADYISFPSFISVMPDSGGIWAGFTVTGNADDRIYRIDEATGEWHLAARLPGNIELVLLDTSILVSGLNSTDWADPNSLFVLDTTGNNNHRKILEIGGSATGFAVDGSGAVYCGTNFMSGPNSLYKWNGDTIRYLLDHPEASHIGPEAAVKLSGLPAGGYDCELDDAGDLLFSINDAAGDKLLALWNGSEGGGANYDTLAIAAGDTDWLSFVRASGSVRSNDRGNMIYALSYGRPVAGLHADYRPVILRDIPNFSAVEGSPFEYLDLTTFFEDPDDDLFPGLEAAFNSNSDVANSVFLEDQTLVIGFGSPGQSNVAVTATSSGLSVTAEFVVGVIPAITGNYESADFEDLTLDAESYWNGSDGSGGFTSGPGYFHNSYNPDWFTWSGWAYSNSSDTTTPGFTNQYSAVTGEDLVPDEGSVYGVSYASPSSAITFSDGSAHEVRGFFVTNSTYAALSMKEGDAFTKKFGGTDGNDEDWFRLRVEGFRDDSSSGVVEYNLADFTFTDNRKDYIIETWQWLDLGDLGKPDSLAFTMSSTDMGEWGMNTPAYFCMDNLYVVPDAAPEVANPLADLSDVPGEQVRVDVSAVFTDPDDADADIATTVRSNTDDRVATAVLDGTDLTLDLISVGKTTVTLEAHSNNKTVVDSMDVTVLPTGSVQQGLAAVTVRPNPSAGRFRITTGTGLPLEVVVHDMNGRLVFRNAEHAEGSEIDIGDVPAGTYILKARLNTIVIRELLIIR